MTQKKNKGGRPPKYPKPDLLQEQIDSYFDKCDEKEEPYTNAGLCVSINLSKQGLLEYGEKPEFSALVKKAKLRIEADVEKRLFSGNATGSIFWLKNHGGYVDRKEQDINLKLKLEDLVAGDGD